jgi:hypothetical protein
VGRVVFRLFRDGQRPVPKVAETSSQRTGVRAEMPKPVDLSVLGLRPRNDLTSTRMLSTGLQVYPHGRGARAVLVGVSPEGGKGNGSFFAGC